MICTHHIITTSILLIDSPNTLLKSNAGRAHARAHTYSFLLFPLWAATGLRGSTCPDHQNLREAISRTNPPKTRLTVLVCACLPSCKSYCFFVVYFFKRVVRRDARAVVVGCTRVCDYFSLRSVVDCHPPVSHEAAAQPAVVSPAFLRTHDFARPKHIQGPFPSGLIPQATSSGCSPYLPCCSL